MTFPECLERHFFDIQRPWARQFQFDAVDVDVAQNPPEDVLDLCKDMLESTEGIAPPPEARDLQRDFKAMYTPGMASREWAPNIGPRFAVKYRHLIHPEIQVRDAVS